MARRSVRGIRFARSLARSRTSGYSRCGYSPCIPAASILVFRAVLRAPSELRAYVTGIASDALSRKAPSNPRIAKYSTITELAARRTWRSTATRPIVAIQSNVLLGMNRTRAFDAFLVIQRRAKVYRQTDFMHPFL